MAQVTLELPSVLAAVLGGIKRIPVQADTLQGALEAATSLHPALTVHLFDESGDLREHVLCFHNDVNSRWLEDRGVVVADGDRITILQAVSGG